ncbi:MAG: ATP-dependent DNA helicase RecG [Halieaceae bacterium]|nr:ATP-dependent DNA helicase RecG [Halieaceae bacterium]
MANTEVAQIPVTRLRGVGAQMAGKLEQLGITSIQDVLFHLPMRYQDRTRVTPIGSLQPGTEAVVEGEIMIADIAFGRRRSLVCRIQDGSGTLTLRFFHFSAAQRNNFRRGLRLRCYGELRHGSSGLEMYHPEYRSLDIEQPEPLEQCLTPVYPSTAGVSQARMRKLCAQALQILAKSELAELIPGHGGRGFGLAEAIRYLHTPPPNAPQQLIRDGRHPAQLRLALEELVAHNLSLEKLRRQQQAQGAPGMGAGTAAVEAFVRGLEFRLTGAQQRVIQEIRGDLCSGVPMLRLVQGDVGSGKTVVAACAALQAISAGYQVVIMAPTEILAEQHWGSFQDWFTPLNIEMVWFTGRLKGKQRQQTLAALAAGEVRLALGTHALFQDDVVFNRLGLVIVDEQHRFGVHQRLKLSDKAGSLTGRPHQLVMTATPIPRTLSMVAYADLDCSVIDELPPGRTPVQTLLVDNNRRQQVVERVQAACRSGRQAYWVCTLIEESDVLQAQAAEAASYELEQALDGVSIGLVHGRLKAAQKAEVMEQFKTGQIQLLVATTVIEVGVDIPNASLMIIENPERLGLAQLHQLRGRVGRGPETSHCVLLYQQPLGQQGKARLGAMRESNDGFLIAERDLALRGPGEVLGTRQTGLMEFRVADLRLHADLLPQVKQLAGELADGDTGRVDALIRRWLGSAERYAGV